MATPASIDRGWDDADEMPLSQGDRRKIRIAELFAALVAMHPCRRHGDAGRLVQLQAELILLLDADLIRMQQTGGRPSWLRLVKDGICAQCLPPAIIRHRDRR